MEIPVIIGEGSSRNPPADSPGSMGDEMPLAGYGVLAGSVIDQRAAYHETGIPVPDRPIVLGALVERASQVKETYLPAWNRAGAEQVSYGRKKTVAQLGHVLGPPVIVTARGFCVVEK